MKNIVLLSFFIVLHLVFTNSRRESFYCKNYSKNVSRKGIYFSFKSCIGFSLSRGTKLHWAGEVTVVLSVYTDSKLVEDNTMVFP
jgi:hypothetical protein